MPINDLSFYNLFDILYRHCNDSIKLRQVVKCQIIRSNTLFIASENAKGQKFSIKPKRAFSNSPHNLPSISIILPQVKFYKNVSELPQLEQGQITLNPIQRFQGIRHKDALRDVARLCLFGRCI